MIQAWMREELARAIPKLTWTIDQYTALDNTGTVYSEGGLRPSSSEIVMRYPNYQVWIRSSNWELAQHAAYKVFNLFHRRGIDRNFDISIDDGIEVKSYRVFFMSAVQDPIQIGTDGKLMQWSINFDVTLLELKEATL